MYLLFARIARFFAAPAAPASPMARSLMEGAEARAGYSPQQARELRGAAQAWLSVVR